MNSKTRRSIARYVRENIDRFHGDRIDRIKSLKLNDVLRNKNPYLFRAKNLNSASDLITALLDARLSSSEEGTFGGFLEDLAIFVAETTGGGVKSAAHGIDIESVRKNVRYLIAVKSGKNWGNSDQHRRLKENFRIAVKVIKQSRHAGNVQPTLGICYGNFKTVNNGIYLHIGGQSFWHLISGDEQLYIDLIEPLGEEAEKHNELFNIEKAAAYNRLIREFTITYCDKDGSIDWAKLVQFVSGNLR
jgi:hypothetical protein